MTLKAHQATKWLTADLGGEPDESVLDILNHAGAHLVGMHTWGWVEQTTSLNTTASQDYASLPANFRGLLEVVESGNGQPLTRSTSSVLIQTNNANGTHSFRARVRHAEVAGNLIPRLYLSPTPSSSTSGAFTLLYLAGWAELDTPASNVVIPYWLHSLYRQCIMAFGRGYKENEGGAAGVASLQGQLELLLRGETFRVAREWDASVNPGGGMLYGGMVDTYNAGVYGVGRMRPDDVSINAPS